MPDANKNPGKLVSVHGTAPAHLQRAIFISVLSFLFFLGMMFAYYIRQSAGYFLLASAFLVIYLITLFSWVLQKRSVLKIYENGLGYKDRTALWSEIESIDDDGTVTIRDGKSIVIPKTINDAEKVIATVRRKT